MNKHKALFANKASASVLSLLIFVLISTFLCGCEPKGDYNMKNIEQSVNAITIGPMKEFTLNDRINTANNLLAAVTDSYGKMNSAYNENASKAAKKAVSNVTKLYGERIEELKKEDFTTWSAEDLSDLALELSDIISAIRKARDLLGA